MGCRTQQRGRGLLSTLSPGGKMCQRAQVQLKPGKRSPVAHGKGPCCKNAVFPWAVKEQKTSNTLCRLLPSFTCRLQPQGCHSGVLSLSKLNARINGVSPESRARQAGWVTRRGRARGPSRASSCGRLCSLPACREGPAPREHPLSTHRTFPPAAPTYRYLPRSQTFLVCYHGNPLPR